MDFDAMYSAITSRDARFDGQFYTAVRSTGIYCRPSCPATKPKRSNVEFLRTAAACQQAGYRACLRCVPEALPGSPEWSPGGTVSARALALVEEGIVDAEGVTGLAARVGYSSRNLNRLLVAETGAPALAHARARRARLAHGLITGTDLALADVAFAAGFSSVRQFNDTVRQVYGMTPSELRARPGVRRAVRSGVLRASLAYRRPFDWAGLLRWYAVRALPGVEDVSDGSYRRSLALPHGPAVVELTDDPTAGRIEATLHLADLRDYGPAAAAIRRLLDLDADPVAVAEALGRLDWLAPLAQEPRGVRLPGCATPVEAALRAVTGQQITVTAARRHLVRLVAIASTPLPEGLADAVPGITHLFPTPDSARLALHEWWRGPSARRDTAAAVLDLAAAGGLDPARGRDAVRESLLGVPGVGEWTAGYTLLRGLGEPDADLSGDAVVAGLLRRERLATTPARARRLLEGARPWRSYAALLLWSAAGTQAVPSPGGGTPSTTSGASPAAATPTQKEESP